MDTKKDRSVIELTRMYEGQVYDYAGHNGTEEAMKHARCTMDGIANAMTRVMGKRPTIDFVTWLGDRLIDEELADPTKVPAPKVVTVTRGIPAGWVGSIAVASFLAGVVTTFLMGG